MKPAPSRPTLAPWLPTVVALLGLLAATAAMLSGTWLPDSQETVARSNTSNLETSKPETFNPGASDPDTGNPAATAAAMQAALEAGNRWVRQGDPDAAIAAYRRGWPARGLADPTWRREGGSGAALAYNLATTLHRRGQRPEALLWYRRAQALAPGDPWLVENLALVRAELRTATRRDAGNGSTASIPGTPRLTAWMYRHSDAVRLTAVLVAWIAFALYLLRQRGTPRLVRRWGLPRTAIHIPWMLAALAALTLWLGGVGFAIWGPRPAVLLATCGAEDPWPAGSEVWVRSGEAEEWRIVTRGADQLCPWDAVAPISAGLPPGNREPNRDFPDESPNDPEDASGGDSMSESV